MNPRTVRIRLAGPELDGFVIPQPAASVRLLVPSPGAHELVMPQWTGNEFLLPTGDRPALRTFTPLRAGAPDELDIEIVLHGAGVISTWAAHAQPSLAVAVSGPGRGYDVDDDAPAYLLAGDESAFPALGQVLAAIPERIPVAVHGAVTGVDAQRSFGSRANTTVAWHESLPDAVISAEIASDTRIWVAGEAAAVQRIRHHLFEERAIPRAQTTIRGYWKHGRAGGID